MKNELHFLKTVSACSYIQVKTICLAFLLITVITGYANGRTDVLLTDGWILRPISDPTPGKQGTQQSCVSPF